MLSCSATTKVQQINSPDLPPSYEQSWDSLAKHEAAPQWYQDAKQIGRAHV